MDKLGALKQLLDRARGFVFDFDGFIADSEKHHFRAYAAVFAKYGHTVDEEEYYKYWTSLGHGARGEIERHGLDLDPIAIRDEKRPIFARYCEDGSIGLFDEAREFLEWFRRTGKPLAIASGTPTPDILAILRNAGIGDMFATVVGSDLVPKIKPHPDVFLRALDDIGLAPADCVVFEDAEKGMQAAVAAGMPVVVVRTAQTRNFDFSDADLVLDSHADFVELLRRIEP